MGLENILVRPLSTDAETASKERGLRWQFYPNGFGFRIVNNVSGAGSSS
jgi:hypothetical protein